MCCRVNERKSGRSEVFVVMMCSMNGVIGRVVGLRAIWINSELLKAT